MSIKVTSKIWCLRGIPATIKFILLKLADNANDQGSCWPSVPYMADDCEVCERTIQAAIRWGEKHKLVKRELRTGKSTVYHVTPAEYVPPQNLHPADCDIIPPQIATRPPQIATSHLYEPSKRTVKEREPSYDTQKFDEFWDSFPRSRRGNKQKALSAYLNAIKRATEDEIHEGTIRYSGSDEVRRGFAKGAAAWLNDDRWAVDYSATRPAANGKQSYADSIQNAAGMARNAIDEKEDLWPPNFN